MVDAGLVLWWLCFLLTVACGIALWVFALLLDAGPETRFRLITAAVVVTAVASAMLLGVTTSLIGLFVGLWMYAIIAGMGESLAGRAS